MLVTCLVNIEKNSNIVTILVTWLQNEYNVGDLVGNNYPIVTMLVTELQIKYNAGDLFGKY